MKHRVLRFLLVVTMLLSARQVWAGRDLDFVSGLADRGYYDLALEQLDKMEADAALAKADRVLLPLLRGQMYSRLAEISLDPGKRDQLLLKATEAFREFEQNNPGHPRLLDVSLDQARILSERASAMADSFRAEKDAAKKKKLLTQTESLFKQAVEETSKVNVILDARLKQLQDERPRTKRTQQKLLAALLMKVKALMQVGDMEYLFATVYDAKSKQRGQHLDAALKAYDVVAGERPTTNFTFLAYVREGMCLAELAALTTDARKRETRLTKAMESFDAALRCKRTPATVTIRLEAFNQKAKYSYAAKDYETAIRATDSYLREAEDLIHDRSGQELLLLRARCLAQQAFTLKASKEGDWRSFFDDGVKTLQKIGGEFPDLRAQADQLMQSWLSKVGAGTVKITESAFVLINRARKAYEDKRFATALDTFQEVVQRATSEEDRKYAAEAWLNIGAIYYQQKAYYETSLAWGKLATNFADVTAQAPDLSYYISLLFGRTYERDEDTFDLDKYFEALQTFVSNFPKDKRVFEATARLAEVHDVKGEYSRAADIWSKADPENPRYAESVMKSGQLYWRDYLERIKAGQGKSPEARDALAKAQEQLIKCGDTPVAADAPTNWPAQGLLQLADILTDRTLAQPRYAEKAPTVLDKLKSRFPDFHRPRQLLLRVRSLCLMKKPDVAEPFGQELAEKHISSAEFQDACRELLVAYQDAGNAAKSTEWQKRMVLNIDAASDEQLDNLAQSFWRQGQHDEAIRYFTELEKRLATKNDPESRKLFAVLKESLGAVYFEAGKYALALNYYKELVEKDPENMLYLQRLAMSQEEGGQPAEGLKTWTDIQDKSRSAEPSALFFEARLHIVRCLKKEKRFRDAVDLIKRTQVLYGGFGPSKEVNEEADKLLKEMGG